MHTTSFASLAIQAGGASRRMGMDKSLRPFLGVPLIQRVAERSRRFSDSLLITANDAEKYQFLNLPVYPDSVGNAGPLAGLLSALTACPHPYLAVVGCDMPFLSPELLAHELNVLVSGGYDAVLPLSADGLEPMHALYRRDACLVAVRAALAAGNLRMIGWLQQVKIYEMPAQEQQSHDPQGLAFVNLNSPDEFEQAEQLASRLGL